MIPFSPTDRSSVTAVEHQIIVDNVNEAESCRRICKTITKYYRLTLLRNKKKTTFNNYIKLYNHSISYIKHSFIQGHFRAHKILAKSLQVNKDMAYTPT